MKKIMVMLLLVLLAFPAHAQVRKPGADFIPEPDWSEEFTQGMIAVRNQNYTEAEQHFRTCIDDGKKIDPNCEYYLALMYQVKGDAPGFRKWLEIAASHGNEMAATAIDLMERYK